MSEISGDQKRAKQLEEARKRVEELKKKNKKKGKKGKKLEDDNDSSQAATGEETTPELERDSSPAVANITTEDVPGKEHSQEPDAEPESPNVEEQPKAENLKKVEIPATGESDLKGKPTEEKKEESAPVEEDKSSGTKDSSKEQDVQDLFENNEESDFLGTIQKQKEEGELHTTKSQLEKVSADLKKLKFVNMEQETTIDELNQQVELLQTQLQSSQQELDVAREELQKSKQATSTSPPLQFTPFNVPPQQPQQPLEQYPSPGYVSQPSYIDRTSIDKWRNWNVDMTTWRSIGSGPIVEF